MMGTSDLKAILFDKKFSDEIRLSSDKIVRGMFTVKHSDHSLDGRPLAVSGPVFYCMSEDVKRLKAGSKVTFNGTIYTVSVVRDDLKGLARVEFEAALEKDTGDETGVSFEY